MSIVKQSSSIRNFSASGVSQNSDAFTPADMALTVFHRFEQQANLFPDRLALGDGGSHVTYAELNAAANRLARAIVDRRGATVEPVALLLEHGPAHPLAIMAVLKAAKFYVALDRTNPPARLLQVLSDSGARLLVSNARNLAMARALCAESGLALLNLDEVDPQFNSANLDLSVPADTPVCLAYTSGSTGQPKGVIRTHRSEMRCVMRRTTKFAFCAADRFLYHTNYSFSMSFTELFGSLLNGGSLFPYVIRDNGIGGLSPRLAAEKITIVSLVPSLLRRLLDNLDLNAALPHLRLVLVGGEPVYQHDVQHFYRLFPLRFQLVNYLGLSELAPISFYVVDHQRDVHESWLPIGFAEPDVDVRLLRGDGTEAEPGEAGELTLRSDFLTPGYWRRPDLTAAAFRPDPNDGRLRIFHTGDLGRRRADGCLEYLGRKDFQAKIRGQTVHPAEVEAALFAVTGIVDAVVVADTNAQSARTRLVAYLVGNLPDVPTLGALRTTLRERLPDYMLPSAFIFVAAIPRTTVGKVDRAALPAPDFGRSQLASAYVAPRTPAEAELALIWAENLSCDSVGVDDNYFDLGGDSLSAGQLMVSIERLLGRRLPPSILLEAPTIAKLAIVLAQAPGARSSLVAVRQGADRRPLFFVPGGDGSVMPYARLMQHLDDSQPVYALETRGLDGKLAPHDDLAQMASDYLAEVRAQQPQGPYLLAGACIGGSVAYEMAQQLRADGQEVGLLLLLDTQRVLPHERHPWSARVRSRLQRIRLVAYPASRFRFHLNAIHKLNGTQRAAYLLHKVSRAGAMVREQTASQRARVNVRVHQTYPSAVRRYQPRPYAGRITLLANEEWSKADPSLGWNGFALESLDLIPLRGDHDTHLNEYAPLTAQCLQECIDRAE